MRIFSGIRPTGNIHIGNYLGAIKQWIDLQEKNECLFCIVDLHAITTPYDPKKFKELVLDTIITYLSVGLNPEKCILFIQSEVKQHLELFWFLNTITPVSELKRMTQFKDKSKKIKEVNAGLLNYPILMAADILLYNSDTVPVGKDQKQHVELTRTIARKFNNLFGETFKVPEVTISKQGAKIMSLQNPKEKMSKSGDPKGCIFIFEDPKDINKKIMSAVTDSGKTIKYDEKKKPGISNLLTIYSLFSGKGIKEIEKEFKNKSYADFKKSLANVVDSSLLPFRMERQKLLSKEVYINEILKSGKTRAEKLAESTMQEVRRKIGF